MGITYNRHFEQVVSRMPDRGAFRIKTSDGYRDISYRELYQQVRGVSLGLSRSRMAPGARAAILSENRPEWVVAYLGILYAGGIAVPLDIQISGSEWRRLLDDSESEIIFVSPLLLERLESALEGSPLRDNIICFDDNAPIGRHTPLSDFVSRALALEPAPLLPEVQLSDVAVIIYTSGTTGKPKGVMLTQENIISVITAGLECIRADENDTFLCLLPLHHVFASVVNVLVPLYLGAEVCFVDTLKRSEILEALEKSGITVLATVPQFFYLFHRRIDEELSAKPGIVRKLFRALMRIHRFCLDVLKVNLGKTLFGKIHRSFGSSLRLFVSGGSTIDPRVAQDFYDLGFTILQGYGLTETAGPCAVTRVEQNVVGSVGNPLPGVEVRIHEPNEEGVGEILIRGPLVMKGYYKNPAATSDVIRDGWFHSGDLGRLDSRGNIFITGRKKEVIVLPSGKNIYPDELEAHYGLCPYIAEIAVLGIAPSERRDRGEKLHAVVVPDFDYLKAKKIANAREILRDEIARFSNQLPKYKRLMSYQIQKEPLPRTTTQKIKRLELKRLIESGQLHQAESATASAAGSEGDREILASSAGREVVRCLRETYHRRGDIDPGMNLELDLGFDSMERVELLASLEQSLGLQLPDGFGAEIHTIRELVQQLEEQAKAVVRDGPPTRQSWDKILSEEFLAKEELNSIRFTGPMLTIFRYLALRSAYVAFRILLGLEVRGRNRLPKTGPVLLCPNHLSYLDPFVLLSTLPYGVFKRVFFVGASEFFVSWIMRLVARVSNIFPVDPDAHLLQAMKVGARGLRDGRILCIFPEGARSFDGDTKEFKKGAAILAREVGVPMIPVGIRGTYEVWPRDSRTIRLHKVRLDFGPPLPAGRDAPPEVYGTDTARLREAVLTLLKS